MRRLSIFQACGRKTTNSPMKSNPQCSSADCDGHAESGLYCPPCRVESSIINGRHDDARALAFDYELDYDVIVEGLAERARARAAERKK